MKKILLTSVLLNLVLVPFVYAQNPAVKPKANSELSIFDKTDEFLDHQFRERSLDDDGNVKLKFGGEARYRLELRDDFNFNDQTYEDDSVNLFRTRLDLTLSVTPYAKFFVQGQDAESFASSSINRNAAFTDRLDLHQLWAEFKFPDEDVPLSVKVGRQKLAYGDQRFVGGFEWSNVARVFDAVKVVYQAHAKFKIDAWYSQVVNMRRLKPDQATHNDHFYGLYTTYTPIKDHLIDSFVFYRNINNDSLVGENPINRGDVNEWTFGNRLKGKKIGFDYGLEWAIQSGNRAHETINAWTIHNELGYTIPEIDWAPRFSVEYNHASGDSDPTDGKINTFDNLYPTNHLHYGYADFISLKNTDNFKIGFDIKPTSKIKFSSDFFWFFLDTPGSPVFNAAQQPIRAANPAASTTVGQELDLLAQWQASKHIDFLIGYSHFFAGPWLKDTGRSDDADFFYVQTGVKF